MKKWSLLLILGVMGIIPLSAQTGAFNGFCTNGGYSASTQGLASSNKLQVLIPSCTVTVYLTGTSTIATIYKDAINTPLSNPFTADALTAVAPGKWLFFAATGQGYDVVLSGGIAPLTFTAPVTLTDLIIGAGGGGGGVSVAATSPILVNGGAGPVTSGTATVSCPSCLTSAGTSHAWPVLSWTGAPTSPSQTFAGVMTAPSAVTVGSTCGGGFTWPSVSPGSPPTATSSSAFTIYDQTTSAPICTVTWGAGQSIATSAAGSETTIPANDDVVVYGPASIDATLQNFTIVLFGSTAGGGGGGAGFPAGSGVPQVVSGSSWGTTYNASNLIPANWLSLIPLTTGISGILPVANGGSGTATPTLISGSGITVSGSWPNQTVTATGGGGGGMVWPAGPGIANCTGTPCTAWIPSYNSSNQIPANFISTLNQSTTGNAGTATSLASTPTTCSTGNAPTGVLANGNATGCAPIGGSVSGQASGVIPLATGATAIGAQSHLDDGNTTASTITSTEPIAVSGATHGVTIASGSQVAGVAAKAVYGADSGTSGYAEVNENAGGYSRICTAANASTNTGCQGSGSSFPLTFLQESQQVYSASTSFTVTFPRALQSSGATAFMIIGTDSGSSFGAPSGWTTDINNSGATDARFVVLHVASAGQTSAVFTSGSSSAPCVFFFEVSGTHALDQSSGTNAANAFVVAPPSITPTANAVVFGMISFLQTNSQAWPPLTPNLEPGWNPLSLYPAVVNGGHTLIGYMSTAPATHVSTSPPIINVPLAQFFGSGATTAIESFSIL